MFGGYSRGLLVSEGKLIRRNESDGETEHEVERVRRGKCHLDVLKTKNKKKNMNN